MKGFVLSVPLESRFAKLSNVENSGDFWLGKSLFFYTATSSVLLILRLVLIRVCVSVCVCACARMDTLRRGSMCVCVGGG